MALGQDEALGRIWQELEPELNAQGYELVEVEFGQQGASRILRLFIDKPGGVTLDDCQAASQLVGPLLDMKDLMDEKYVLEMSSPGFDRPIRKPADFERFAGERVRITAHAPVEGRKQFKGGLKGYRDGLVVVDCDGREYGIHIENLKKARLVR